MIKQQVQVKINMSLKLKKAIEEKAKKYDLTLASYVKYAVFNQLNDEPVCKASSKVEKAYSNYLKNKPKTYSSGEFEKILEKRIKLESGL